VDEYNSLFRQPLGEGRSHVIGAQVFKKAVFHENGHGGEGADHVTGNRYQHMADATQKCFKIGQLFDVFF